MLFYDSKYFYFFNSMVFYLIEIKLLNLNSKWKSLEI